MNIIIVGMGKEGQKITEMLSNEEKHDVTVIDVNRDVVEKVVSAYDVLGFVGSGASIDTLLEAGVKKADVLITVTASDELNILTCLIARKAGNCQTIARVRNPEYSKEITMFKNDLGLAMILNPKLAAAREMARALRFPSAIQIDTFAKGRIEILKFSIPKGCILDELKIVDVSKKLNCDILVCGIERDGKAIIPGGDFIMKEGDVISIVASIENGTYFFKKIGIKTNRVKDTIIVGGGEIGFYLAKQLAENGISVKLIEQNSKRCDELCLLLPKVTIINGDGTDNNLLYEAGLEYCESFVSLTNIDEENIMLSLFAKSKTSGKIITKINRIAYDNVISEMDLGTVIYPKNITAEYIVRFVRAMENSIGSNVETVHFILDGKAEALEFNVGENSPISNVEIQALNLKKNILIACISRNGKVIIPRGHDVILKGDTVIVVTATTGFKDISDILE